MISSTIKAISSYLPAKTLSNDQLAKEIPGFDPEESFSLTGVRIRHIAAEGEIPSDMAKCAAEKLFEEHHIDRTTIDFIIFVTTNVDYVSPASACLLQERLNLPESCGSIDVNQGCTGYIYGLSLANSLIVSGDAENVLLLVSDYISHYIHPLDKTSRPLFGDAAAASLIVKTQDPKKAIGKFVYGTRGKGADKLIVKHFRSRHQIPEKVYEIKDQYGNVRFNTSFYMNGSAVFLFSVKIGPILIQQILEKNHTRFEEIDMFIFHQANKIILETIAHKVKIPQEKYYIHMENCGNVVSSTIPLAFEAAEKEGKIKHGMKIMLLAFGIGYSWGGTILDY